MRTIAGLLGLLGAVFVLGGCSEPSPQAVQTALTVREHRASAPPTATPGPATRDGDEDLRWSALSGGESRPAASGRSAVSNPPPSRAPSRVSSPPPAAQAASPGNAADSAPAVRTTKSPRTWLEVGTRSQAQPPSPQSDDDDLRWLALSGELARAAERPSPATHPSQIPYAQRRGPAYPGDMLYTLGRDAKEILPAMWDDTKAVARSETAWVLLGLAGAAGIAINGSGADGKVADHYTRHGSGLNTFWDTVGDAGGNPGTHFAVAGGMYFYSQAAGDVKMYETSKTLLNALAINGLFNLALKGIVRTESPNGDELGWPSGHTSSSFCFATVMYDAYGPWVGIPLLAFATYVGYERVDARNHDFSDVVSGALIGIAIGHLVARNHETKIFGMELVPYVPSQGGAGLALSRRW